MELEIIKDVGLYLRKSRAKGQEETDETLEKHRAMLIDFAKKNNFRYTIYQEVGSADSIKDRPEMIKLLNDVQEDLFDAVLVVDVDRLTRGNEEDSGKIKRIFTNAGIFIITPNKVYNLENEDDETYLDFQTFMARQEYKMIKRRLIRGKKQGSRMGHWTNGIPPVPYYYNPDIKGLVVDKDKLSIYNLIKSKIINDLLSPQQIAWELNSMLIPSPKNKKWNGMVIQRMMIDETHLGRIISNKTKGNLRKGQQVIKIPKEQWIIKENCHEAVKTIEEHEKILSIISSRKKSSYRGTRPKCILSSVVRCGYCGSVLQLHKNKDYDYFILNCPKYSAIGEKCQLKGIREDKLVDMIWQYVEEYINQDYEQKNNDNKELEHLKSLLLQHNKEKVKINDKIKLIYQMFEDGTYNKEEFNTRREQRQKEIAKIDLFIEDVEKKFNSFNENSISNNIELCKQLKQNWSEYLTTEEKNKLLSLTFEKIEYFRDRENPTDVSIKLWFN